MTATLPSLAQLKPNPHWAKLPLFNRKNWSRVRFGDIVENVNERVEPSMAAEAIYVGLDDLDSGSLHIRRWGKGSDVIGTKLGFRKGDVIFGRRRAYQRKLAVAETDGICSAHAMVARAKPKVVLPEFLPFLMMSDKFMNRAVDISVGSLSPTINWTTLKLEEFDLPPLDQQRRIAEILWAVDEVIEKWLNTLKVAKETRDAFTDSAFHEVNITEGRNGVPTKRLGDAFKIRTGGTPSRANPEFWGGRVPWVKTGEVKYEDIYDTEEKITELGYENSAAKLIPKDSVLMALYGQGPTLGRVAQLRVEATVNQACAAIFPSPDFNMRYLYYYLARQYANIRRLARGASQPNINALIVKDFIVPAPTLNEQNAVAADLAKREQAQKQICDFIEQNRKLMIELTNALL
jgi:type I restriction enzyme, S subunit